MFKKLTIFLLVIGTLLIAKEEIRYGEKLLEVFQGYCINTSGRFEEIQSLAKALNIQKVPKHLEPLVKSQNGDKSEGYIIYDNKDKKDTMILGIGKPDACTIVTINKYKQNTFINMFKKSFKLKLLNKSEIGIQVQEMYTIDGKTTNKIEAIEKGIIILSYLTTSSSKDILTIGYLPSPTVEMIFKKKN